jgi:hypothetical protein
MSKVATYFIAQYVPDLFRREPRNIGVLVEKDGRVAAQFLGEIQPGELDGRKLRGFDYPHVYRQWVEYWRDQVYRGDKGIETVVRTSRDHYRVIHGGELTDTGEDSVDKLAAYLYSLLVSEGGFAKAIANSDDEMADVRSPKLEQDVESAFKRLSILAGSPNDLLVRHPIRKNVQLRGRAVDIHTPDFVQENGRLYVMELVDFSTKRTSLPKEHAGRTAYMFSDLRREHAHIDPIAIVQLPDSGYESEDVYYGMKMLRAESNVVVWTDPDEKGRFLRERHEIAMAEA